MSSKKIKEEIELLNTYLLENGLAYDINAPIIRSFRDTEEITWSGSPRSGIIFGDFATLHEYLIIISRRQFHVFLNDGGLLQFNYTFSSDSTLIKQRLLYFPCPLEISVDDVSDIQPGDDFVSLFQMLLEQELDKFINSLEDFDIDNIKCDLKLRTPIRFEYDPSAHTTDHSASHMHINKSSCRWPVFGPVSLGHFIRFIFKMFYQDIWSSHQRLREWPLSNQGRTVLDHEIIDLFIESTNKFE